MTAPFVSAPSPSGVVAAASPQAAAESGASVTCPSVPQSDAPGSVLDTVGIWLITFAAFAVLNLGIPALIGLTLGGGR